MQTMTAAAAIPGVNSAIASSNTASPNELFALTDEQILEIEPGSDLAVIPSEARNLSSSSATARSQQSKRDSSFASLPRNDGSQGIASETPVTTHESPVTSHPDAEPPPWLAAQMKDPWTADEARELWNGVLQARQEAAAYREVFAKPEEARAAAELARTLEEIDAAFYGGAGKSPEQQSAGRTALAQRMLREDPAAFREMVFAGLRALEAAGSSSAVAAAFRPPSDSAAVVQPADGHLKVAATSTQPETSPIPVGARHVHPGPLGAVPAEAPAQNPHLTEYRAFEKSANEELERSVGGAINRALEQALPVAQPILAVRGDARTGTSASNTNQTAQTRFISHNSRDGAEKSALQERLGGAIRADVESALKGDAQLGEQIAQLLSARRFDENTRAQVVRLINDRAQQLVPVAARRVIQDWTQTAFAAHRRNESAPATGPVAQGESSSPVGVRGVDAKQGGFSDRASSARATSPAISAKSAAADRAEKSVDLSSGAKPRAQGRAVDYRKLSDEQILEL